MNAADWQLLVRPGCHLCSEAERILAQAGVAAQRVDVDRAPALREEYGALVPVLRSADGARELIYPFDASAVRAFAGLKIVSPRAM